jgi:hypothetical protein
MPVEWVADEWVMMPTGLHLCTALTARALPTQKSGRRGQLVMSLQLQM